MSIGSSLSRSAALCLVASLLNACSGGMGGGGAPKTALYSLAAFEGGQATSDVSPSSGRLVGVGPIFVPDYLNRPQIVTHPSPYQLEASEFHRWGGSLDAEVGRVITQNLAALLPGFLVVSLPLRITANPDRQVTVQILGFERDAEGTVVLVAHWGVLGDGGREPLVMRQSTYREVPADASYEAIVASMSRLVGAMSKDIATEVQRTTP